MKNLTITGIVIMLLGLSPAWLLASEEVLTLSNGTEIKVLFFEPKASADKPRLALLISGATSNTFMARAQFWLGKEFVDRGWAIAVPISPDRNGFGGDNARLLPELVWLLQTRLQVSTAKPLLVGISSGGSTALAIATQHPTTFAGVIAAPGRLQNSAGLPAMAGLPVYLRIGEKDDFRWNRQLEPLTTTLQAAGARVDAAIVPDARHIFQLDWNNLESWLGGLQ